MDYKTCSGSPSALGGLLTSCLPAAFGPTVFDNLAGIAPCQPKDSPRKKNQQGLNSLKPQNLDPGLRRGDGNRR
jgi:hypothetical protein